MSEEDEDAKFAAEWTEARKGVDYFRMAHVLSARLRQLDKRSKKANARADKAEAELKLVIERSLAQSVNLPPSDAH